MGWTRIALWSSLAIALPACSGQQDTGRTLVASFYPLAWAAQRIAGPGWDVIDLTPPGVEAHDVELSLEDRAAIEEAELVVYMGQLGFQPQVEEAVEEVDSRVLALGPHTIIIAPAGGLEGIDPHVWLSPGAMRTMSSLIAKALSKVDPPSRPNYLARAEMLKAELERLDEDYRRTLHTGGCQYRTVVVPHEAFNYMVGRYAIKQFGLAGVTPEGEPTADRLIEARRLIEDGEAGAVFFEAGGETQRAIENLAADAGVPALPLSTLESEPPSGDYISVMEDNLRSLREGLGCE
jgi:zinc transport system substrate-binding protein